MGIRQFLRDRSISFKLNVTLILIFAIMAVNVVGLTTFNINHLFADLSEQQTEDQQQLVDLNLVQSEQNIIRDAQLLAASSDVFNAVSGNSQVQVAVPLLGNFDLYRNTVIEVFDINGNRVYSRIPPGVQYTGTGIDRLLRLTLVGGDVTDLVVEDGETEPRPFMVGAVPVANSLRNVVGAVVLSRPINTEFLDALRQGHDLYEFFVVYEGQVVASNGDETLPTEYLNSPMMAQALSGQVAKVEDFAYFAEDDSPHHVSYLPLRLNERIRAVIVALFEVDHLVSAQQQQVTASILGIVIPALVAVAIVVVTMRFTVVRPLSLLKQVTERMTAGNLATRAEVVSNDEVGQLASAFNVMAEAVEYRDKVQIVKLEQQLIETQAAREQAERSDQVKSAFLASMSHELRTPLNAIINFTKFVAQGDFGPVNAEQKSTLFEVVDSAKHLLNLINDVLDMSKIESGSLNLFVQDGINLTELLNGVVSTANSLVQDKPVEIRTDIDADLPTIRGDKQRIRQIFLNVMSNACKFTQEGYIEVRATHDHKEVVISVTDTGYGIAPEDQPAVFEAFKQTSAGLRQGGGTGLGMPISKNLVEIHGGRLWLESEVGKGSTFYVALPIQSEELVPLNLGG